MVPALIDRAEEWQKRYDDKFAAFGLFPGGGGFAIVDAQSTGSLAACLAEPTLSSSRIVELPPGHLARLELGLVRRERVTLGGDLDQARRTIAELQHSVDSTRAAARETELRLSMALETERQDAAARRAAAAAELTAAQESALGLRAELAATRESAGGLSTGDIGIRSRTRPRGLRSVREERKTGGDLDDGSSGGLGGARAMRAARISDSHDRTRCCARSDPTLRHLRHGQAHVPGVHRPVLGHDEPVSNAVSDHPGP